MIRVPEFLDAISKCNAPNVKMTQNYDILEGGGERSSSGSIFRTRYS
jgi:hypothetical protein